jgi:hypothetical protein
VAQFGFFGAATGGNGRRHRWRLLFHLGGLPADERAAILTWARTDLLPALIPALERAPAPLWPITLEWLPPDDAEQ